MKFGGTSVEDAPAFERLMNIVGTVHASKTTRPLVVVSAMSGVTNALLASVELANAGDSEGAFVVSSTGRQQPPGKFDAPLRQRSSGGRGRGKELPPVARR